MEVKRAGKAMAWQFKEGQGRFKDLQVGMIEVSGGRQGGRRWMGAEGPGASSCGAVRLNAERSGSN